MSNAVLKDSTGKFNEVVDLVCESNAPVTIQTADGREVKVIPVPKPIRMVKGRPVYALDDAKYLYLDCPWLID
jgi:hypothetical protein